MRSVRQFAPDPKLQLKYILYVLLIFLFFLFPWVLLGLLPGLGWGYVVIYLGANALWMVVALVLIPFYYRSIRYELTDQAIIVHRGILTRTQDTVPYRMITNLSVKRGPLDRWLGTGSIAVHTAGFSQQHTAEATLSGLSDYEAVRREIGAALQRFEAESAAPRPAVPSSVEGEQVPQLLSQMLDELRALRRTLEQR